MSKMTDEEFDNLPDFTVEEKMMPLGELIEFLLNRGYISMRDFFNIELLNTDEEKINLLKKKLYPSLQKKKISPISCGFGIHFKKKEGMMEVCMYCKGEFFPKNFLKPEMGYQKYNPLSDIIIHK